jgi:hypothetical protein
MRYLCALNSAKVSKKNGEFRPLTTDVKATKQKERQGCFMAINSQDHEYEVGAKVAETDLYRIYLCKQADTNRSCLLQIASEPEGNGPLQRSAFLLQRLAVRAEELEVEYARVTKDPNRSLGYDLGFPELVESFISADQGGRVVNILAFRNVDDPHNMTPISNIIRKDRLRADLRTSAWIMGKTLKMLGFTQDAGIGMGQVNEDSILLEPDEHYVLLFDFAAAATFDDRVPRETRAAEIVQAAKTVIELVAGDVASGKFPDDEDGRLKPYTDFLLGLASGDQGDAHQAHREFYSLVDTLWERGFYPATFLKR